MYKDSDGDAGVMKEYNYGVNVNITVTSKNGTAFQVAFTPYDSAHDNPQLVWYDVTNGSSETLAGQTLTYGDAKVLKDGVTEFQFVVSTMPGETQPVRCDAVGLGPRL